MRPASQMSVSPAACQSTGHLGFMCCPPDTKQSSLPLAHATEHCCLLLRLLTRSLSLRSLVCLATFILWPIVTVACEEYSGSTRCCAVPQLRRDYFNGATAPWQCQCIVRTMEHLRTQATCTMRILHKSAPIASPWLQFLFLTLFFISLGNTIAE